MIIWMFPQKINGDSPPNITHHNYNSHLWGSHCTSASQAAATVRLFRRFLLSSVSAAAAAKSIFPSGFWYLKAIWKPETHLQDLQVDCHAAACPTSGPCNSDMVWDHKGLSENRVPHVPPNPVVTRQFYSQKIWHQNLRILALKPQNPAIFGGAQTRRISESLAQPDKGGSTLAGGTKFIPALSWAAGGNQDTEKDTEKHDITTQFQYQVSSDGIVRNHSIKCNVQHDCDFFSRNEGIWPASIGSWFTHGEHYGTLRRNRSKMSNTREVLPSSKQLNQRYPLLN